MSDQNTDLTSLLQRHRDDILRVAKVHGARRVRCFGSAARGDANEGSDVDLLVDMEEDRNLLDRIALQQDLEELLGVAVDVVTEKALHPILRTRVLEEALEL